MNYEALLRERRLFLVGCAVLVAPAVAFRLFVVLGAIDPAATANFANVASLITKMVFIYLVFRLSRFLQLPVWLIIIYCVLAPFSVLYLIPFAGLLIAAWRKGRAMQQRS
jgi:hypothetical protein